MRSVHNLKNAQVLFSAETHAARPQKDMILENIHKQRKRIPPSVCFRLILSVIWPTVKGAW